MRKLGITTIFVGLMLTLVGAPAYATAKHKTVGICHATGSKTHPWVYLEVGTAGLNGHGKHENDLIGVLSCPSPITTTTTAESTTTTTCKHLSTTTTTVIHHTTTTSTTHTPTTTTLPTTIPEVTTTTWVPSTTTTIPVVVSTTIVAPITTTTTQIPETPSTSIPTESTTTTVLVRPVTDPPREVPPTVATASPLTSTTSTSLVQSDPSQVSGSSTSIPFSLVPQTKTIDELAHTGFNTTSMLGLGVVLILIGSGFLGLSRKNIQDM